MKKPKSVKTGKRPRIKTIKSITQVKVKSSTYVKKKSLKPPKLAPITYGEMSH